MAAEGDDESAIDVVQTTTDASGQFRLGLLAGRLYSGWAIATAAGDDGAWPASAVLENLPAVAPTDFVLARTSRPGVVTVSNAVAWAAHGGTRLRIAPLARNRRGLTVPIAAAGTANVPAMAGRFRLAEVLDARGGVLFACRLADDDLAVPLPPPQLVPVQVDDDTGAPIAGATIAHEVHSMPHVAGCLTPAPSWPRFRVGAETDAEGKATLVVPRGASPWLAPARGRLLCVARRQGFAEAVSGWDGEGFENARAGQAAADRLRFVLRRAEGRRVEVVDDKGLPRSHVSVWLRGRCDVQLTDMVGAHERVWTTHTDTDGIARFDDVTATTLLELGVAGFPALHPEQVQQAGTLLVDGRTMRSFPLQVLTDQGAPAANALLRVTPLTTGLTDPHGSTTRLDGAGRAALRLPPGEWLIATTDGIGIATEPVAADRPGATLALRMMPLATLRLAAVDADGTPATAATVELMQVGRSGPEVGAANRAIDQVAYWLAQALVDGATTDAHGEVLLRFVQRDPRFQLRCRVSSGRAASEPFDATADAEALRVRLASR